MEPLLLAVKSPENMLRARALASKQRLYAWIYHHDAPRGLDAPEVKGAVLNIGELRPGNYTIEFWDTYEGRVLEKREIAILEMGGQTVPVRIPLPTVKQDLAAKVKPR